MFAKIKSYWEMAVELVCNLWTAARVAWEVSTFKKHPSPDFKQVCCHSCYPRVIYYGDRHDEEVALLGRSYTMTPNDGFFFNFLTALPTALDVKANKFSFPIVFFSERWWPSGQRVAVYYGSLYRSILGETAARTETNWRVADLSTKQMTGIDETCANQEGEWPYAHRIGKTDPSTTQMTCVDREMKWPYIYCISEADEYDLSMTQRVLRKLFDELLQSGCSITCKFGQNWKYDLFDPNFNYHDRNDWRVLLDKKYEHYPYLTIYDRNGHNACRLDWEIAGPDDLAKLGTICERSFFQKWVDELEPRIAAINWEIRRGGLMDKMELDMNCGTVIIGRQDAGAYDQVLSLIEQEEERQKFIQCYPIFETAGAEVKIIEGASYYIIGFQNGDIEVF